MSFFDYRDGVLCAEGVALPVIADAVGTPVHVYSASALRHAANAFTSALQVLPSARFAFAVKANPNGAVLRLLAECGYGADIVSCGELRRALDAGIAPADVVFSGVGKTDRELIDALEAGIGQFNLELEEEGRVLAQLARRRGMRAPAVLRVNPDVDGGSVVDGGWTSTVARIMAAVGVSTTRLVISDKQPFCRFVTAHAQHRQANALRETGAAILICTETELNDQLGDRCSGSSQKSERMAEDGDEI